ncbi:MAG TPA: hypothetical protein VKX24_11910 [Acidimicrobiia bacterium]|nr:hypothetical protein [Acidimicrobiia bacterium]
MIPTVWLCGPPGVGKSVVGWALYQGLVADGVACAYVDIDQLGICYPEPLGDPGRHRLKAENLRAMAANVEAWGASRLVVSGVLDAVSGTEFGHLPRAAIVVCRLRADADVLTGRLGERPGADPPAASPDETARWEGSTLADVVVDTAGLGVAEVVAEVRRQLGRRPTAVGTADPPPAASALPAAGGGRAVFLCGPAGVGKSTVGFALFRRLLGSGRPAAYVDLDQIGFCSPAPLDHGLRAANLAALWHHFGVAGAGTVVVVGPVGSAAEAAVYDRALEPTPCSWFRLQAGDAELTARILTRGSGGSWPQPGDPWRGAPPERLLAAAAAATVEAGRLEESGPGRRVVTDGLAVEEIALSIWSHLG